MQVQQQPLLMGYMSVKKKVCIIITRIRLCLRGGKKEDECQCLLGEETKGYEPKGA